MATAAAIRIANHVEPLMLPAALTRPTPPRAASSLLLHHARHIREQLFGVVDDPVLDRVLDAADAFLHAGFGVEALVTGAVEDFQVVHRVLRHNDKVGQEPLTNDPEFGQLARGIEEGLGAVHGRAADDFERMEAGLLEQLEFLRIVPKPYKSGR